MFTVEQSHLCYKMFIKKKDYMLIVQKVFSITVAQARPSTREKKTQIPPQFRIPTLELSK